MAGNFNFKPVEEGRVCPEYGKDLEPSNSVKHRKWYCENEGCPLISCKFDIKGEVVHDIKHEGIAKFGERARPLRLHYYTTVLQYSNTIQEGEEG